MTDWGPLAAALAAQLAAKGDLAPAWREAFDRVPRHVFTRRFFRQSDDLSGWMAVAAEDPGAVELIYTDATWVTQLDNDPKRWHEARAAGAPVPGVPTSSSSAPSLMALMLEALDVRDGQRVLEIGTGTGYNAALLCHRLGSSRIATVEVDPVVAAEARSALRECGLDPAVVAADGAAGHAPGAPYDRLIATCSTPNVPSEWIAQVTAGGLILVSLHRDLGGGPLVLLRVDGQGWAGGRFLSDYGGFMPVRAHPLADAADRLAAALAAVDGRRSHIRCRRKKRPASSASNHGVPVWPPRLACSVFSVLPKASYRSSARCRGCPRRPTAAGAAAGR